jgi:hypothetical protein
MTPHQVAAKYIGQKERPGNSGFTDREFEVRMHAVGFVKSHAWCAYFAELVFKEAYPDRVVEFDRLFSGSTLKTYENFKAAGYKISMLPAVDNLVIFQSFKNGKPQATGHAGIVAGVTDSWRFWGIEGNTSDAKSREGYIVATHTRKVLAEVKDGLKVKGFITIPK